MNESKLKAYSDEEKANMREKLKTEGILYNLDNDAKDIVLSVGKHYNDKAKIDKSNKLSFEEFKTIYKGQITDKCLADYGSTDDEKLWEDAAKELFLQSEHYIPNEEDKPEKIEESKKLQEISARPFHDKVAAAIDARLLSVETVAEACLAWLPDDDIGEIIKANDWQLLDDLEESEKELNESKLQEDQYKSERRRGVSPIRRVAEQEVHDNEEWYKTHINDYLDITDFVNKNIKEIASEYNLRDTTAEEACKEIYKIAIESNDKKHKAVETSKKVTESVRRELLKLKEDGKGLYDYVANNYYKMSQDELKELALDAIYVADDAATIEALLDHLDEDYQKEYAYEIEEFKKAPYDFVANNYYNLTTEFLKEIALNAVYAADNDAQIIDEYADRMEESIDSEIADAKEDAKEKGLYTESYADLPQMEIYEYIVNGRREGQEKAENVKLTAQAVIEDHLSQFNTEEAKDELISYIMLKANEIYAGEYDENKSVDKEKTKCCESRKDDVKERIAKAKEWKKAIRAAKEIDDLEKVADEILEATEDIKDINYAGEDIYNGFKIVMDDDDALERGIPTYIRSVKRNMRDILDAFIDNYEVAFGEESLKESKSLEDSNIAETFKNYKAFEENFGPVVIVKDPYDRQYKVYPVGKYNSDDYIYYTDDKSNIEGWLYGAVMANNGIVKKLKTESVDAYDKSAEYNFTIVLETSNSKSDEFKKLTHHMDYLMDFDNAEYPITVYDVKVKSPSKNEVIVTGKAEVTFDEDELDDEDVADIMSDMIKTDGWEDLDVFLDSVNVSAI